MEDLIIDTEALLDDLRHLRELDDGTLDNVKLDRHIETLEILIDKLIRDTKL